MIPHIIETRGTRFKFIRKYKKYCLYQNIKAKYYECFSFNDIKILQTNTFDKRKKLRGI